MKERTQVCRSRNLGKFAAHILMAVHMTLVILVRIPNQTYIPFLEWCGQEVRLNSAHRRVEEAAGQK